ncbi:MAG TPA: AlpA family phage regulatory protein [Aromatoleum sp.]|uniref:helix-turn-helix transcriptional regulator n=1 Tax=Aromatoleum sp. TaxID=2307007 RepID=UPI002B45966F|nr:AlpA family phage regulatory protein [Aromatoleum sp.]HJV26303.1 AlpA family phage regulatory protein [Aromatoleum sp.]
MLDLLSTKPELAPDRIVRESERRAITGRSRVSWWQDEREGRAPKKVQIGPRAVGWRMSELQAWVRGEWHSRGEA